MIIINKGDSLRIELDYTVNGIPLSDFGLDEVEFMYGDNRYTLSDGTITLNTENGLYGFNLDQEKSFKLEEWTEYQLRIKKGNEVASSCTGIMQIGSTISREIL